LGQRCPSRLIAQEAGNVILELVSNNKSGDAMEVPIAERKTIEYLELAVPLIMCRNSKPATTAYVVRFGSRAKKSDSFWTDIHHRQ
jgi:hypothetical protein